jgi:hypothetical protein
VEGRGVDDHVGPDRAEHVPDLRGGGDLEPVVAERRDGVPGKRVDQVVPEGPRRPDDDDAPQKTLPMRRSVDSISWSSDIQPML